MHMGWWIGTKNLKDFYHQTKAFYIDLIYLRIILWGG